MRRKFNLMTLSGSKKYSIVGFPFRANHRWSSVRCSVIKFTVIYLKTVLGGDQQLNVEILRGAMIDSFLRGIVLRKYIQRFGSTDELNAF
jgi:hypothetical protein